MRLLSDCLNRLNRSDAVADQLAATMRDLCTLKKLNKDAAEHLSILLETIIDKVGNLSNELRDQAENIDMGTEAFEQLEERLIEYQRLKRKYGNDIQAVVEHGNKLEAKIRELENVECRKAELEKESLVIESELMLMAEKISEKRKKSANILQEKIKNQLIDLGFLQCDFRIMICEKELTRSGIDKIDFEFIPNPGQEFKSLKEIASSGEISRIMLAIKTVLANADKTPILIFDEVDANIGGMIATKIGKKLRNLSKSHQVFTITHNPQVAAGADHHFHVDKRSNNGQTSTIVCPLSQRERKQEIARMLGGKELSRVALKHASELISSLSDED